MNPYYVAHGECNDVEPFPGWYVSTEDGPVGPFRTREAAQDRADQEQDDNG